MCSLKQMVGWLIFSCLTQSCFQSHTQVSLRELDYSAGLGVELETLHLICGTCVDS